MKDPLKRHHFDEIVIPTFEINNNFIPDDNYWQNRIKKSRRLMACCLFDMGHSWKSVLHILREKQ